MLMLKSTHEAIVAKKDAEIAGLMKRIATLVETQRTDGVRIRGLKDRCIDLWTAKDSAEAFREAAEARLAVFTAPRKRGLGGRFVSSKGGVA